MKTIEIKGIYRQAWESLKNNWLMLLALAAIYVAVAGANKFLQQLVLKPLGGGLAGWALVFTAGSAVNLVFLLLMMKFSLQVVRQGGAPVRMFSEMELDPEELGRFLLTDLVFTVLAVTTVALCFVPLLVLVVVSAGVSIFTENHDAWRAFIAPGLASVLVAVVVAGYLMLALGQTLYACLDQGLGPWDSLKESWRLTAGAKMDLLLMLLASLGVLFLGLLCLCVGVIPAMLLMFLTQPLVYLSLLEQSGPRPTE